MGRRVDGKANVGENKSTTAIGIRFYGRLHPKRKVTFTEELKRLARHYGLRIGSTGGKSKK